MIVDDDAITRGLLRQIVSQEQDVDIVEAEDGMDAWSLLNSGVDADLCLLDVMMPRMDGIELLRRLRQDERFKRLKVIICSVVRDGESIKAAISLDVEGYILKPFTRETVREVFHRATQYVIQAKCPSASNCLEPGPPVEKFLNESGAFLECAVAELVKSRQWLRDGNRLAVWESAGLLLHRARKLKMDALLRTLESLESAVMGGNTAEALIALDATELTVQSML